MKKSPEWVDITLRFAGIVNVVWGLVFALFTNPLFRWGQLPEPTFPFVWQLIGIAAIVLGLAYYIASFNIARHTLVIVIGFALKVTSTVAVWKSVLTHDFSLPLALYFSVKDLLWLVPFALVLYHVFKKWRAPEKTRANPTVSLAETLSHFRTSRGHDLLSRSQEQPLLLVFLPSTNSAVFRACAARLSKQRRAIAEQGTLLILVQPARTDSDTWQKLGLAEEEYVSDPDHRMSNTFNLKRATLKQVLETRIRRQGWTGSGPENASLRELTSDGFRLPAAFLIHRGEMLKRYHYEHPNDHPDYAALAKRD